MCAVVLIEYLRVSERLYHIWWQRCRRQKYETHGADVRLRMTTRSGATYRRTKPEEETMSNPREGDERQGDAGVSDLLRLQLEDRRRRDEELAAERERREEETRRRDDELAAERARREEEVRQHATRMKEQMDMMRSLVETSRTTGVPSGEGRTVEGHGLVRDKLVLTKLTDAEDIEAFLTTFERLMTVYGLAEDRWAIKLAPQLTGRALEA